MGAFLSFNHEVSNKIMFRTFIESQKNKQIIFNISEHDYLNQDIVIIYNSETNKDIAIMYINYDSLQNIICIAITLSSCIDKPKINSSDCIGIEQNDIENINHYNITMNFKKCLELIIVYLSINKLEEIVII
jgi:hypothetical protein